MRTIDPTPRPANRAERRAAAKGRSAGSARQPAAPRHDGPKPRTTPVHTRTDFAARRRG